MGTNTQERKPAWKRRFKNPRKRLLWSRDWEGRLSSCSRKPWRYSDKRWLVKGVHNRFWRRFWLSEIDYGIDCGKFSALMNQSPTTPRRKQRTVSSERWFNSIWKVAAVDIIPVSLQPAVVTLRNFAWKRTLENKLTTTKKHYLLRLVLPGTYLTADLTALH